MEDSQSYMNLCELCGREKANFSLSFVARGRTLHLKLCKECADECRINYTILEESGLQDYLPYCFRLEDQLSQQSKQLENLRCPECGLGGETFLQTGQLGCSACYPLFHRFFGLLPEDEGESNRTQHTPLPLPARNKQYELLQLQRRLKAALEIEAYEEAAHLRDRIAGLEKLLYSTGSQNYDQH